MASRVTAATAVVASTMETDVKMVRMSMEQCMSLTQTGNATRYTGILRGAYVMRAAISSLTVHPCASVTCINGECDRDTATCVCSEGWTGPRCKHSITEGN